MHDYEIHSIYVLNGANEASEIRLSKKYATELRDGIRVERNEAYGAMPKEKRVASFTTLFGENGSGKTSILMALCQTCGGAAAKGQPLGILFSRGKRLLLFRGRALRGMELAPGGVALELVKEVPFFDTVFYSTSPFEAVRRAELARYGTFDVTPAFGPDARFDGLSIILNYDHLGGSAAQACRDREIEVRGWITRELMPDQRIDELWQRHGYQAEARVMQHARGVFRRWLKAIPGDKWEILTANLKIIAEVEGNGSVVGRFVGGLLRLATDTLAREVLTDEEGWQALLALSTRVIDESGFIPANGETVREFLLMLRKALGAKDGTRFKVNATSGALKAALDQVQAEFPGVARFAANLGFLKFTLRNLSSGQFAFLHLFAAIGSAMVRLQALQRSGPLFLLIDEGEMFLHPAWQREYIESLLDFVGRLATSERPVHVVISTHSLIVAADAPPFSLFDVDAGQEANGFGYGPGATLDEVYGVARFAGTYTAAMVAELVAYLKNPKARTTRRIRELANALAEPQLKKYVLDAISARTGG